MGWPDRSVTIFNHTSKTSLDTDPDSSSHEEETGDSTSDLVTLSDLSATSHRCLCLHFHQFRWHHSACHCYQKWRSRRRDSDQVKLNNIAAISNSLLTTGNHQHQHETSANPTGSPDPQKTEREGEGDEHESANSSSVLRLSVPTLRPPVQSKNTAEEPRSRMCPACCLSLFTGTNITRVCLLQEKCLRPTGRLCVTVAWSLLTTVTLSLSISLFIEAGVELYLHTPDKANWSSVTSWQQQEQVSPPSFATQFVTIWVTLIYPLYLLVTVTIHQGQLPTRENLIHHMMIVTSDQPTVVKALMRCALFSLLWQVFVNLLLRSLQRVPSIDCAAILAVFPCFAYLLCWIVVHRRFIALRVIAFILGSSGVILNIYSDLEVMWPKCLTSIAVVSFSIFVVLLKRSVSKPSFRQIAAFYFVLGIFNTLACWPIFVLASILTNWEPIHWGLLPWSKLLVTGASLFVLILFLEVSSRKVSRAIRVTQPFFALPICIGYHIIFFKDSTRFSNVRLASLVVIAIACQLNAVPNRWLKAISKLSRRYHQTSKSQGHPAATTVGGTHSGKQSLIITGQGTRLSQTLAGQNRPSLIPMLLYNNNNAATVPQVGLSNQMAAVGVTAAQTRDSQVTIAGAPSPIGRSNSQSAVTNQAPPVRSGWARLGGALVKPAAPTSQVGAVV